MIGSLLRWLGRRLVLYCALVVAIGLASLALPWLKSELTGGNRAERRHIALSQSMQRFDAEAGAARATLRRSVDATRQTGASAIRARIAQLQTERAALTRAVADSPSLWIIALQGSDAVLAAQRTRLRLAMVDHELAGLHAAEALAMADALTLAAQMDIRTQREKALVASARCDAARAAQKGFEDRWRWRLRSWIDNEEHRTLVERQRSACGDAQNAIENHNRLAQALRAMQTTQASARVAMEQSIAAIEGETARLRGDIVNTAERARVEWAGTWSAKAKLWAERIRLRGLLIQAAIALLAIIAMPYLIRLFCFFVLAPAAMRRSAIRLSVPGGTRVAVPPAPASTTSVMIRLDEGQELLVRQGYLQTSSHSGGKSTRWLLDWCHPLTSLASGLFFLTRVHGAGEATTVSAIHDAFAEVTIVDLPVGSSCVLQPRALAAVVQSIADGTRIESRWRLFSINAWLTMQLRYMVFHGPAQLVVKGGRGVRVEQAERGRIFWQEQLVGFSADLAYSVTRTELFWPYFLGREPLLKDRVEAGDGILIVEEAPMAGRGRDGVRHGIEGLIDAGLKLFGL